MTNKQNKRLDALQCTEHVCYIVQGQSCGHMNKEPAISCVINTSKLMTAAISHTIISS